MTKFQQFMQRRARERAYLYCAVCNVRPPRFVGGLCAGCGDNNVGTVDHPERRPIRSPYAHPLTDN
jgi:hypothetical protein